MADNNELDKTIEQLEAEVLAELEEAAGSDAPKKGAVAAEKDPKDGMKGVKKASDAVVEPDAKSSPTDVAADDAKEVSGDDQQKGEGAPEKMQKVKKVKEAHPDDEDDEEEEGAVADESKKVKESASLKTKSQYLEYFGKMKAAQVKEMLKAYQSSLQEEDDDEDKDDDKVDEDNAKKQDEAVERTVKEIDIADDVEALMSGEDSLSENFKDKAATIFEAAVKSKIRTEAHRIYEEIRAEKETEMDTFKDELATQVDTYLNYVVEEWTKENELAIERGLKGEIAEDFIGGLKQLFEDHYIDVPDEKYDVLEAQSEKIAELEDKINNEMQKNVEIKESNTQLVREQVIIDVSEDLADTEVEKFKDLTTDVDFADEDSFRDKLNTLKESYFPKTNPSSSVDEEEETGLAQDVEMSTDMEKYMKAIRDLK